jgi:hypothetical protein
MKNNIKQYDYLNILNLIIVQSVISILIIIVSFLIDKFLKLKSFNNFLICNFTCFYLLFYYKKINSFKIIEEFQNINSYLDNILTIIVYIFLYFILNISLNRFNNLIKNFLFLFLFFNFIVGFYNTGIFKNFNSIEYKSNYSENKINLDQIRNIKHQDKINVYLIILDGMISLDKAETLGIINSKFSFYKKLNDNGYKYNNSFNSNYPVTYASIQSTLYGYNPITENSVKYKNRLNFYPYNMNNKQNFFYKIIDKLSMNFFWIGNKWGLCKGLKSRECFYNYTPKKNFWSDLILSTELFYINSIFSYYFNFFNKDIVTSAYDFLRYEKFHNKEFLLNNKSDFFLMHVYKPHKPYDLDENCNDISPRKYNLDEKKFYKINYICAFKTVLNWDKSFLNINLNNIVIILGDHGWSFDTIDKNHDNFALSRLNDVFFAYKMPKSCQSIKPPNSNVNVMRFILNCVNNLNLEYIPDTQYVIRYEGHKDYGKAFKLK